MDRCSLDSDRYNSISLVTDSSLTPSAIDFNGLRELASDIAGLEARVNDKWRHRQMRPYLGNTINWEWLYDSFEYRTWLRNTNDGVGDVLWLSGSDAVHMSLFLSNLTFTHLEGCLPASSNDTVYFYYRAPPPDFDLTSHSNPGPHVIPPPNAAVLCVFIAQIFKSRGDYIWRLNPTDHAALRLAFQATKQFLASQHDTPNECSPEVLAQALAILNSSEDLLWSVFGGSVTAKRWRSLDVVLDGLDYPPPDEGHRFLEQLSKLQNVVSEAEGSLRPVISARYSVELHRVLAKTFRGILRLDTTAERVGAYLTLGTSS